MRRRLWGVVRAATNLLYGLRKAVAMMLEEGLPAVFARHRRLAAATRAAVEGWGLEILWQKPSEYLPVLTVVMMPEGMIRPGSPLRSRRRADTAPQE